MAVSKKLLHAQYICQVVTPFSLILMFHFFEDLQYHPISHLSLTISL